MPGCPSNAIDCVLRNHRADCVPKYEAISYSWGSQSAKCEMTRNNVRFWITSSIYDALLHLRHADQSRLLCIDQENSSEQSYQVSIMRQIYRSAASTTIWLRPANGCTQEISKVVHHRTAVHEDIKAMGGSYDRLLNTGQILQRHGLLTRAARQSTNALLNLLENPWFERVWVIQGAVVSEEPKIALGNMEVAWNTFAAAVTTVSRLWLGIFVSHLGH